MTMPRVPAFLVPAVLAALLLPPGGPTAEDHSAHNAMMHHSKPYTRTEATYAIPEMTLINQEGEKVDLGEILDPGQPLGLTFIFTTCTTICPVMTATFRKMQHDLGDDAEGLRLVTISIDPEFDTPAVLKDYARRYEFRPGWQFLTGDPEQIKTVLKSFDAYYGDKMNHRPLYFFKRPDEERWIRIEGLASGSDMVEEYRELIGH